MPRPRFQKLSPEIRATILARAAEEFAEHGFEGGSYNRIIERSGLSKGAMYYYFDDKQDLLVTVLEDAVKRLIVDAGSVESVTNAEEFWRECERWYVRSFRLFREEPAAIALLRTLLKSVERGTGNAALAALRRTSKQYVEAFIAHGQRVFAIRDDLPKDLLVGVLMAIEEGIDTWILEHADDISAEEMSGVAATMTALYRRVAERDPTKSRASPKTKTAAPEPKKRKSR